MAQYDGNCNKIIQLKSRLTLQVIVVDVSWGDCVDNGSIVTCAHDTAWRAPYEYTRWRSIWPVKQILNYQMRFDVS